MTSDSRGSRGGLALAARAGTGPWEEAKSPGRELGRASLPHGWRGGDTWFRGHAAEMEAQGPRGSKLKKDRDSGS